MVTSNILPHFHLSFKKMSLALEVHSVMKMYQMMLFSALFLGTRRAEERRNVWDVSTVFQPKTRFDFICRAL